MLLPSRVSAPRRYSTQEKPGLFNRRSRPGVKERPKPSAPGDILKTSVIAGIHVHVQGISLENLGKREDFHWVWLRDHCNCSKCRSSSGQKLYRIETFDPPIAGAGIPSATDTDIYIKWYDGHQSVYSREWLAENAYSNEANNKAMELNKTLTWDADLMNKSGGIPTFSYDAILSDEAALHSWLTELDFMGVTLIKGAPKERGVVSKLTNLVGYPRNTMYGLTWDVESIPNPNNVAYTSLPLPIHADLCYYEAPPGVQLLHCLKFEQKTGGENLFVDAFKVAEDLRAYDEGAFQVLAQIPTIFHKDDSHHLLKHGHTIIDVARHSGAIKAINWSPPFEGVQRIPAGHVENYYSARKLWYMMLNEPKYAFQHRSEPGDVVVFNNRRVLHSRTEFDEKAGHRLLEGAYIGSDEFADKLRALNRKHAPGARIHDGSGYTL